MTPNQPHSGEEMTTKEKTVMQGVIGIFVSKDGNIIDTAADFEKGGAAGFSKKENQRMRVKRLLVGKVVRAYSSPAMTDHLSEYTYQRIFDDLINTGAKIHYEYIGYGEQQ